jgi:ABC-type lipoprotein export system ATPase subunit
MEYISQKYDGYKFDFSGVSVLLGANGAGKSTFLAEFRNHLQQQGGNTFVFVEGGRTIQIKDVLQLDRNTFQNYDRLEQAIAQHENKRKSSLANRVFDALVVLDKKGQEQKTKHSDDVELWMNSGKEGECPTREQPPLELLFEMFNEIFPLIEISFDSAAKRLKAKKNQTEYSPTQFSDGEKQVFSILADFIDLSDEHRVIIVDEPELNLHPELAERVWTLLENEYPDKIFIYASHSINFALRDNVKKVYVLSNDSEKITLIDSFDDIERVELTAFLGGLPGILSTNKVIVTEGHEKSFDSIFYRWLVGENSIEIYPGGGCTDVVDIVGKSGLWGKISTKISLIGVVDSDFRSTEYLSSLQTNSVLALPYHEAESFLCIPDVISQIGRRIGSQEEDISSADIADTIFSSLEENKLSIAAKRVFASAKITLGVSLTKRVLRESGDQTQLLENLKGAAEEEIQKAVEKCGIDSLERSLQDELANIDEAIGTKNINDALKFLPGKELLNKLAPKAGCRNGDDLMRSLRRNFNPDDFEEIKNYKDLISAAVDS